MCIPLMLFKLFLPISSQFLVAGASGTQLLIDLLACACQGNVDYEHYFVLYDICELQSGRISF